MAINPAAILPKGVGFPEREAGMEIPLHCIRRNQQSNSSKISDARQKPARIERQRHTRLSVRVNQIQLVVEELVPGERSGQFQESALVASQEIVGVSREQPEKQKKRERKQPIRVSRKKCRAPGGRRFRPHLFRGASPLPFLIDQPPLDLLQGPMPNTKIAAPANATAAATAKADE